MKKEIEDFILSSPQPIYQDVLSVTDIQVDSACGENENFVGQVLRVKCSLELKNGRKKSINIIVKKQPLQGELYTDMYNELKIFNAEINMYENVLNQMKKLLTDCDEPSWNLWPQFYGHSEKDIYLQDLSEEGYKSYHKGKALELNEALCVLSSLGTFHGLSLSLVEKGLFDPSNMPPNVFVRDVPALREVERNACNGLADAIETEWGPEWQIYPSKIRNLGMNLGNIANELWYSTRGKCDVINHGDSWINNLLFKYDSFGRLKHMKFVDFQASHYNCYSWDIMQVFYSGVMPRLRDDNINLLLSAYLANLTTVSRKSGYTGKLPTRQEIEKEIDRLAPCSLVRTFITYPFFLNPDASTAAKSEDETYNLSLYQSKYIKDIIKDTINYFSRKQLF